MSIWSAVEFAQHVVSQHLKPGGIAFDATMGNGHDTLFLLHQAGESGMVIATDIQQEALVNTTKLLSQEPNFHRVRLMQRSHDCLDEILDEQGVESIDCAMFNLGYLPGGDKSIITHSTSTLNALDISTRRIRIGGVITVVLYTGHEGGADEAIAVKEFAAGLAKSEYECVVYAPLGKVSGPECVVIMRER